jgi:HAMP domain-containing protein
MHPSPCSRVLQYSGALVVLSLVAVGCSSLSGGSRLHASAKGTVQLQEVADWSFEASHPAVIDYMTMMKVVKGVFAEDSANGSAKLPASGAKPMRVFSDEDAEFLAPLLAQGLSQAKPEQMIGFTVSSSAGSGAGPTAGTLYVQGGTIYLTIASSGNRKAISFMPHQAARVDKALSHAAAGNAGAMSIAIDYQALAKSPMPAPNPMVASPKSAAPAMVPVAQPSTKQDAPLQARPVPIAAPPMAETVGGEVGDDLLNKKLDELRQARESAALKETEIQMLRKEVQWMKQELRERTDELKAMRAGKVSAQPAPKKKTAEAHPLR